MPMSPTRPLLSREFILAHRRPRILQAVAELSAERGYESMTVSEIVKRAHVARKTLYDSYGGKEEVFLAAVDAAFAGALERAEEACAAAGEDWRERVRAGLAALLAYVAEHPAEARMAMIEALVATPASAARYEAALAAFTELLRQATPQDPALPETIEESLAGGVAWILNRQIRRGEAEQAGNLLPELSEFVLSPWG
jgi:AcrR family transcriptional regulator